MEFSHGARPRTWPRQARRATLDAPTSGAPPATIARPVCQLTARSSAAKRGCARPARSNFARPARPPLCVQRLVFSREAAPSVRPQRESEAPIVRNRCAGHGQRSRAMRGQRTGSAHARARGEDDEAPPCAAAPWPMRFSRGNWHFTVDCGRLLQSGPRPDTRLLRQPALEGLTRSARTDSPRQDWPEQFPVKRSGGGGGGGGGGGLWRGGRAAHTCSRFREVALPKSSPHAQHIELSITDSACKNQLVVVSVQYGPFNPYIPIRSTTIGKSRVAKDPIAMRTSWRSNSDITRYPRMSASGESSTMMHRLLHASGSHPIPPPDDPKTNQYNQDLRLIHSRNGKHLESPNEGSSIDHRVTIYLHAQNITMFPTNETWYFASQILVSSSGGLILILTAQSTRNMFRIHSDY
ncbi:hypothetical protein F511_20028 [Dorcoceras hygrometricum]|uniref:Uncharacterized protein n=1 Tax=Dorcoceras hygrometricum TaxID=472368 RepID=A0A2Z7CN43_9LAMI|nr:hypothetical protein F511_20028 [Dorcoceras hygrometricum]